MPIAFRPKVKICCIGSEEEARLAIRYGASAVGLVSHMPSGPGVISEDLITRIAATLPAGIASFLLTSAQDPETIIAQQRRTGVNTVQLCDSLDPKAYPVLRRAMPSVALIQVIHVMGVQSVKEAVTVARFVDAILLDSGNPSLPVKQLGGTGRRHDWNRSHEIVKAVDVPVFLAGGLNPENVREAIAHVHPFGLDVCSGVRSNGHLDEARLRAFFAAVNTVDGR